MANQRYDNQMLTAALAGYEIELQRIQKKILEIKERVVSNGKPTTKGPHRISAEGRARIAAAQRRRWAASKKLARA